jgi:competence protein ComEC
MFTAYDIQRSPFLRIVIPFIIGITIYVLFPSEWNALIAIIYFFLLSVYIAAYLIPVIRNKFTLSEYHSILTSLLLIFSGYYYTCSYNQTSVPTFRNSKGIIAGEVISDPQIKEKSVKIETNILAIKSGDQWEKTDAKVLLYLEKNKNLCNIEVGDRIVFEPVLQDVKNCGNPREFDYKKYLSYNLIFQQAYLRSEQYSVIKSVDIFNLKRIAGKVRRYVINIFSEAGFSGDELAVASALSIGYVDDLDAEIKQSYSASGAMHILSVSGLHVGIIFVVFSFILSFLNRKKWMKILKCTLLLLILWFYALLSGLSPCILRAALMFSFIIVGQLLGRYTNIYNTLAASAFILLLINPFNVTNIGFQFSYLAVIGIVFLYPKIYSLAYIKNKLLDKVWGLICVSLAAQIIVAPLSIYYFHQFPNYFLITNIIVIPISTVIIYLVIAIIALSWWPAATSFLGLITQKITYILNYIVSGIEDLPGSVTNEIPLNISNTIIIYFIIFSFIFYLIYKKYIPLLICMSGILVFLISSFYIYISSEKETEIYIYNIDKYFAMNLVDGKKNYLFTNIDKDNRSYNYTLKNNWIQKGLDDEKTINLKKLNNQFIISNLFYLDNPNVFYKDNCFAFHNIHFALVKEEIPPVNDTVKKIPLDFVILSQNARVSIEGLLQIYDTDSIIIDSSNSNYWIKKWKEEAAKYKIGIYDVKERGAYYKPIS